MLQEFSELCYYTRLGWKLQLCNAHLGKFCLALQLCKETETIWGSWAQRAWDEKRCSRQDASYHLERDRTQRALCMKDLDSRLCWRLMHILWWSWIRRRHRIARWQDSNMGGSISDPKELKNEKWCSWQKGLFSWWGIGIEALQVKFALIPGPACLFQNFKEHSQVLYFSIQFLDSITQFLQISPLRASMGEYFQCIECGPRQAALKAVILWDGHCQKAMQVAIELWPVKVRPFLRI